VNSAALLPAAQRVAFYQGHLDRVSRSFAVCIRELHAPLREWTSLAYLLCRVLDTVEDSQWPEPTLQAEQYTTFEGFIREPPHGAAVSAWAQRFPATVAPGEYALLQDSEHLFAALHALPEAVQRAMQRTVLCMSAGMQHYTAQAQAANGVLRLQDLREVNRYCYFVAGLVGHLLTQLFAIAADLPALPQKLLRDALHFGLFLQKVNLMKDQRGDEAEGRFLVPDRLAVAASLQAHARGALAYVQALPQKAISYRIFCGWSLFLGAASLPAIEAAYAGAGVPKLPRAEAQALLQSVAELVQDNATMQAAFDAYMAHLPKSPDAKTAPDLSPAAQTNPGDKTDWFAALADIALPQIELRELGLV
jgi:phytoene/squalene synthetase